MPLIFNRKLLALVVATACFNAGPALAETGYLWELRNEMVMTGEFDGMVPSNTQKVCVPKQQPETPGMDDNACEVLESSRSGNRGHWKAKCKDGVTVISDFTYQGDTAYQGTVTSSTSGGTSKMKIAGKRLGTCTLGAAQSATAGAGGLSCHEAVQQKKYDFVGKQCPKQAQQLIRKNCAGRDSDALAQSPDGAMCDALGYEGDGGHDDSPQGRSLGSVAGEVKSEVTDDLIQKGVGRIKGLINF